MRLMIRRSSTNATRGVRAPLQVSLLVMQLLGTLIHLRSSDSNLYASAFVICPLWITTTNCATGRRAVALSRNVRVNMFTDDHRSGRRRQRDVRHKVATMQLHARNDFESPDVTEEREGSTQPKSNARPEASFGGARRRQVLRWMVGSTMSSILLASSNNNMAQARGLVQFPCLDPSSLLNTYHLMRTGLSLLEQNDIWNTNPLFLTNREDALSPVGETQVVEACQTFKSLRQTPTVVRYSLAASCMDAATIVSREIKLGRDRVVAEYTYLDPRAIGQWDTMSYHTVQPAVWAMDEDESTMDGTGGRPPPNEDGTPNETLADQAVRLRQLMSVLETLYSGDTVLLIFPDGTGPALLSALMAGIPLNHVHQLEYQPGEVRLNVTGPSTLALFQQRQQQQDFQASYQQALQDGRQTLQTLRNTPREDVISRKEEMMEQERLALEAEFRQQQQQKQDLRAAQEATRLQRQQQIEAAASTARQDGNHDSASPVLLGVAGAVAAGGIALAVAPSSPPSRMQSNSIESVNFTHTIAVNDNRDAMTDGRNFTSSLYSRGAVSQERVNGDETISMVKKAPSTLPVRPSIPLTVEERKEAARIAMDEYMNRDDGAEDWLQSLTDILQDDEEVVDDNDSSDE